MDIAYFDNAATTPIRPEVLESMTKAMAHLYGNPSSVHAKGREAKSALETARKNIAGQLNALPGEIIFTSGGTESNNMIISGAIKDCGVRVVITSAIEHNSVRVPCDYFKKTGDIELKNVALLSDGSVDLNHMEELLKTTSEKVLVSLMHVNNEIGNITDVKEVSRLCKEYGALFHCDAVQSIGHFYWDLQNIPVDFLSASGHKFHGPKGSGFAFIRKNTIGSPLLWGGSQERSLRSGTEATHNIVGLDCAFCLAYRNLQEDREKISGVKSYFVKKLKESFPSVVFNGLSGDFHKSTYTLANICFPNISEDKMMLFSIRLDINGIACSKGSACQSGSEALSHVLEAMPMDEDLKKGCFRFSFSIYNTLEEVDRFIAVAKECLS